MSFLDKARPVEPKASTSTTGASFIKKARPVQAQQVATEPQKKGFLEKTGDVLNAVFGGKKIGEAIGTQIARARATPQEKQFIEPGPTGAQIAGDVARVGLNFVPVAKLNTALNVGTKALGLGKLAKPVANIGTGAAIGYGADVSTKIAEGQPDAFKPGMGTAIGTGLSTIPYVGRGLAKVGQETLGATTGTGAGVIKQFGQSMVKGGESAKVAREALRGGADPQGIVDEARTALGTIIKNRSDDYSKQLSGLKTKKNIIDHTPIISKFNKQLEEFGVFRNADGTPNFSRAPGLGRYEKDLTQLSKTLNDWGTQPGDNTIAGIDKLKQVIDDFRIGSQDSKKFDTFVSTLRSEAKNIIKKDLTKSKDLGTLLKYEKMLGNYEKSTKEIKEIQKALSLGDKASMDTAFRKLSTVLRTNNEIRKQAIKELDRITGGTLLPKIAGQQLSEALPRGLLRTLGTAGAGVGVVSGGGILPMLALASAASPRIMGELISALGFVGNKANIVKDAILKLGIKSPGDYILDSSTKPQIKASNINVTKTGTPALTKPKNIKINPIKDKASVDVTSKQLPQPKNKSSKLSSKPEKLGQSFLDKIKNTPNKQGGFIKLPQGKGEVKTTEFLNTDKPLVRAGNISGQGVGKGGLFFSDSESAVKALNLDDRGINYFNIKNVPDNQKYVATSQLEAVDEFLPDSRLKDYFKMLSSDNYIPARFDGDKREARRFFESFDREIDRKGIDTFTHDGKRKLIELIDSKIKESAQKKGYKLLQYTNPDEIEFFAPAGKRNDFVVLDESVIVPQKPTPTLPKSKVNESVSLPDNNTDLITEAKKYKSAEDWSKNVTIKQFKEYLNDVRGLNKTKAGTKTGAVTRKEGDYLWSQDKERFMEEYRDFIDPSSENSWGYPNLKQIWKEANKKLPSKPPKLGNRGFISNKALGGLGAVSSAGIGTLALGPKLTSTTYERPKEQPVDSMNIDNLKKEIAHRETGIVEGNPYTYTNKNSDGTKDLGKYQVNEDSLKTWAPKVFGKQVSEKEFLNSPDMQEKFFEFIMKRFKTDYGIKDPQQAMALWHKGWGNLSDKRLANIKSEAKDYLANAPQ